MRRWLIAHAAEAQSDLNHAPGAKPARNQVSLRYSYLQVAFRGERPPRFRPRFAHPAAVGTMRPQNRTGGSELLFLVRYATELRMARGWQYDIAGRSVQEKSRGHAGLTPVSPTCRVEEEPQNGCILGNGTTGKHGHNCCSVRVHAGREARHANRNAGPPEAMRSVQAVVLGMGSGSVSLFRLRRPPASGAQTDSRGHSRSDGIARTDGAPARTLPVAPGRIP